jgi:CBS domain-containing protein
MSRFPLVRIVDFISRVFPFNTLERDDLSAVVCHMQLAYHPRGKAIIQAGGPPADHLYIIHSGSARVSLPTESDEDNLVDMRGEGEVFGSVSLLHSRTAVFNVTAHEDLLTFMLPGDEFKKLVETHTEFRNHFQYSLAQYIRASREPAPVSIGQRTGVDTYREITSQMRGRVSDLMSAQVLTCSPNASIQDAAREMTRRKVGSIVVTNGNNEAVGLVTDTDLRVRVVAQGVNPEEPVERIMSRPPLSISPGAFAFEAMFEMTRYGIHHLLVGEGGRLLGVVSDHDIKMITGSTPVGLARNIETVQSLEELDRFPERIRRVLESLLNMGSSAEYMMDLLNEFMDRLFLRLFELCEAAMIEDGLGPAPTQYSWLALGRAGRKEQAPPVHQDYALVFADVPQERVGQVREWFIGFARRVGDAMKRWGFDARPYENLGIGSEWCRSAEDWIKTYEGWIRDPAGAGNGNFGRIFDLRAIQGESGFVRDLREILWKGINNNRDISIYLARDAAKRKTPLCFFRNMVMDRSGGYSEQLDLERQGIEPLVAAIRLLALEARIQETNTLGRLKQAAETLSINKQLEDDLHEAFSFMTILMVSRYLETTSPSEDQWVVTPPTLTASQRKILKDCFAVIETFQEFIVRRVLKGGGG